MGGPNIITRLLILICSSPLFYGIASKYQGEREGILSMMILWFPLVSMEGNLAPIMFGLLVFIHIVMSPNVFKTTFYTVDMECTVSISLLKLQGPYISQPFVAFLRAQITLIYYPIFFLGMRRFGRLLAFPIWMDVFGYHFLQSLLSSWTSSEKWSTGLCSQYSPNISGVFIISLPRN